MAELGLTAWGKDGNTGWKDDWRFRNWVDNWEIRDLLRADLNEGFLDVLNQLSEVNLTHEDALKVYDKLAISRRHAKDKDIVVLLVNNRIIGTGTVLYEQKFIHGGGVVAHIEDVVVDSEYRGNGWGKKIVNYLLERAKKKGCYKAILVANDENVPFYTTFGFVWKDNNMRLDLI